MEGKKGSSIQRIFMGKRRKLLIQNLLRNTLALGYRLLIEEKGKDIKTTTTTGGGEQKR